MDNRIVWQELRRQAAGMVPLAVVTYGGFALFGYYQPHIALSILVGTLYALFNFYQIGRASVRIAAFYRDPSRAQRSMFSGYLTRYVVTAALVVISFQVPFLNTAAVIIPLFYTKIILLILNTKRRKGG